MKTGAKVVVPGPPMKIGAVLVVPNWQVNPGTLLGVVSQKIVGRTITALSQTTQMARLGKAPLVGWVLL